MRSTVQHPAFGVSGQGSSVLAVAVTCYIPRPNSVVEDQRGGFQEAAPLPTADATVEIVFDSAQSQLPSQHLRAGARGYVPSSVTSSSLPTVLSRALLVGRPHRRERW